MQRVFRHEYKYICSSHQITVIRSRIDSLMTIDHNVSKEQRYHTRSLYFDDSSNTAYYQKENGIEPREKYRLRMYNHDLNTIKLEQKRKEHGMTDKRSCALTVAQVQRMIAIQSPLGVEADEDPLLHQFALDSRKFGLRPVIIVEYDRIPYAYMAGNVRVTIDMNVCSSNQISGFLDPHIARRPLMQAGQHILEVKWDYCLPDFLKKIIQTEGLQRTAVSKYYQS
ncbi:MAG: polyphosphate polymerase domain-containing protein, partial [Firmicutes bacterium]|nr:polyphosphate polymerase domain-containing protein [Bacillota bacterium]